MKPYRDLLLVSAVMELESVRFMRELVVPDWDKLWSEVAQRATGLSSLLAGMAEIRVDTLRLLDELGEDGLHAQLDSPASWNEFFGASKVEPEELFRWIGRHEYYHLGQIIAYHWIRGDDPYKRAV
jgi:hypothetical protein